jgi:hypothetical protein
MHIERTLITALNRNKLIELIELQLIPPLVNIGLMVSWKDSVLEVKGKGAKGQLLVQDCQLTITLELNFPATLFQRQIINKIEEIKEAIR